MKDRKWVYGLTALLAAAVAAIVALHYVGFFRAGDTTLPPDPPETADRADIQTADRLIVPHHENRLLSEEITPLPPRPAGAETNLVDITGWTCPTPPLGTKYGTEGERIYRQDEKQVYVRLWRVETEKARMKPQFEIGYKRERAHQQVEMIEVDGYPILVNHSPALKVGIVEILLLDGFGKIDFTYHNMNVEEVMDFTRNFVLDDLERNLAAAPDLSLPENMPPRSPRTRRPRTR
jgi:hypothetical protein